MERAISTISDGQVIIFTRTHTHTSSVEFQLNWLIIKTLYLCISMINFKYPNINKSGGKTLCQFSVNSALSTVYLFIYLFDFITFEFFGECDEIRFMFILFGQ